MGERRFDAVVFDFDGTILDTETPHYEAWRHVYERHGHELTLDTWSVCVGTRGGFDPYGHLESLLGEPLVRDDVDELERAVRHELLEAEAIRPGVIDWLDAAAELGLGVAVASSSSARSGHVHRQLTRFDLRDRFQHIACWTEDVEPKPAPDLYLVALEAIGVPPARAIAVEDSPNGVAAAKAAGLFCLAVPGRVTEGLDFSAADLLARSLADVPLPTLL